MGKRKEGETNPPEVVQKRSSCSQVSNVGMKPGFRLITSPMEVVIPKGCANTYVQYHDGPNLGIGGHG